MDSIKYKKVIIGKLIYRSEEDIPYYLCYCDGMEDTLSDAEIRQHDNVRCMKKKVVEGFNDFATLYPELVTEWDFDKNKDINPKQISSYDTRRVWWKCSEGHSYELSVVRRSHCRNSADKTVCPICAKRCTIRKVQKGLNDLATVHPELVREWHPTKNKGLTPSDVLMSNGDKHKYWWILPCGHERFASIYDKLNSGCPICNGQQVLEGFNDLSHLYPDVAKEWNYEKNKGKVNRKGSDVSTPDKIAPTSKVIVWWKCSKGHEWEEIPYNRIHKNYSCPYCSNHRVLPGFNDLQTEHPDLAKEWNYNKNGTLKPSDVSSSSGSNVWWICSKGHEFHSKIYTRTKSTRPTRCPICANKQVLSGYNDLSTIYPDLAKQWHPTKNNELKPDDIVSGSTKKVWWRCKCGFEWEASPYYRLRSPKCPSCKMPWNYSDFKFDFMEVAHEF